MRRSEYTAGVQSHNREECDDQGVQCPRCSYHCCGRIPGSVRRDRVIDRSRYLRLAHAGGRKVGVRIQENVVLCAVFEVVQVQVERRRVGAFEHLREWKTSQ